MANGQYPGVPDAGERSMLRSGPLGKSKGIINIWEMILLPWFCLVLVLTLFVYGGQSGALQSVVYFLAIVLLGLAVAFTYSRFKAGRNAEVVLGGLCVLGIVLGSFVGFYAQVTNMNEYWRIGRGASYANVLPTELAATHNDATTIEFSEGSRVDTVKTFGYLDGRSSASTVYCVAPIQADPSETRVQYWAAGTDCCFSRDDFHCGDSTSTSARGAVVWSSSYAQSKGFVNAIEGAEKAYDLQAGDEYLLVKWVEDPIDYRNNLWRHTMMLVFVLSGVYLLLSAMIGCALFPQMKQN